MEKTEFENLNLNIKFSKWTTSQKGVHIYSSENEEYLEKFENIIAKRKINNNFEIAVKVY